MLSLPLDLKWEIPAAAAGGGAFFTPTGILLSQPGCRLALWHHFPGCLGRGAEAIPVTACISLPPKTLLKLGESWD